MRAIAGKNTAADEARNKLESERERAPAEVEECVTPEANRVAATGRPAPNAAGKLKPRLAGFNYRRRVAGAAAIGGKS